MGVFRGQTVVPDMVTRGHGRIVSIGSILGSIAFAWFVRANGLLPRLVDGALRKQNRVMREFIQQA